MIKFHNIQWRNLLGTGNAWNKVSLASHPNTLIVGNNGAGKSTLLDALCFVLYGKALRNINKPLLLNSVNNKDCLVEVTFSTPEHTYRVRRGMKPTVFDIEMDGSLIPELPSAAEQQEWLENYVLKCNYKAFTQVVILGAASYVPFMRLTPADRRKILEDLLDIEVFAIMQSLLKDQAMAHKEKLLDLNAQVTVAESQHELVAKYTAQWEAQQTERREQLYAEYGTLETATEELRAKLQDEHHLLQQAIGVAKTLSKVQEKVTKLEEIVQRLAGEKGRLTDALAALTADVCSTCSQPIAPEVKSTKLAALQASLDKNAKDITDALDMRTKVRAKYELAWEAKQRIPMVQDRISQLNGTRARLDADKQRVSDAIVETQQPAPVPPTELPDLDHLLQEVDRQNYEKYVMDQAAILLKDKGIRTRVIQQYLPVINHFVNEYLASLNFSIQFTLDDQFNETIKSRHRDQFSYENFSEGEKRRIDLALLLTWRAVARLKNSVYTNLLIFDEIFDSSLDNAGAEDFLRILHEMDPDTNVFVISHRTDQMLDKFKRVLTVNKVKGFSTIKVAS